MTLLLWRNRHRGKHHFSHNGWITLCGLDIHGWWETEGHAPKWADEDLCLNCASANKPSSRKVGGGHDA